MNAENLLGKKIMELREAKNLTQAELAEKLGVSDKMISKWECGETNPNLNLLPAIADCFDTNIDSLFDHRHNYKDDITKAVFEYTQNVDSSDELNSVRNISFWALFGLSHKYCAKYNGKEVADEVLLEAPIPDALGRPTVHTDIHGYVRSIENKTLNMQVINVRPEDNFNDMFDQYKNYKYIFETLAMPNVEKIIKYLYTDSTPENLTIKYVSEQTGTDEMTVEKIFALLGYAVHPNEAVINGEKVKVYMNIPSDEIFNLISVAYGYVLDNHGHFGDIVVDKKTNGRIIKGAE